MRSASLLLLASLALTACGEGEALTDPDAVADRIAAQAAADFEGIRDFTVRGAVDGEGVVAFFRRAENADSLVFFDGRAVTDDPAQTPVPLSYSLPSASQIARGLRGNARLAGTTEVDGVRAYVLEADDPGVLVGAPAGAGSSLDSVRILIDAESFHVREVRLSTPQTALDPDAPADAPPLVQRQRYDDFRTVDGLSLPFRTTTVLSGVVIPDESRIVQGGMLDLQRRQAQQLPPDERARVLADVERQLRFLETGEQEQSFVVTSVEVNAGVPDDLFAPPPSMPDTSGVASAEEGSE